MKPAPHQLVVVEEEDADLLRGVAVVGRGTRSFSHNAIVPYSPTRGDLRPSRLLGRNRIVVHVTVTLLDADVSAVVEAATRAPSVLNTQPWRWHVRTADDGTVFDLSADSGNNWNGPDISTARAEVLAAGITINGLAILCRHCSGRPVSYDLEAAFADRIIGGPGAFLVTAENADNFAAAVRRKLVLEIGGLPHASRFAGRRTLQPNRDPQFP